MPAQLGIWISLSTIVGCGDVDPPEVPQYYSKPQFRSSTLEESLLHAFGSENCIAVIRNAESVQAYRLAPGNSNAKSFDEYKTTSEAIPLPAELVEKTPTFLLKNRHDIGSALGRQPDYVVRLHFSHGDESVDVLLCFFCMILKVYQDSELVGGGNFGTIAEDLLEVVKELFPNDNEIQGLKLGHQRKPAT